MVQKLIHSGGESMFAKSRQWVRRQNLYVWAAALGLLGLIDMITPGSTPNHLIGFAIVIVAVYMWVLQ